MLYWVRGSLHYYILDPLENIKNKRDSPEKLIYMDNNLDNGMIFWRYGGNYYIDLHKIAFIDQNR